MELYHESGRRISQIITTSRLRRPTELHEIYYLLNEMPDAGKIGHLQFFNLTMNFGEYT